MVGSSVVESSPDEVSDIEVDSSGFFIDILLQVYWKAYSITLSVESSVNQYSLKPSSRIPLNSAARDSAFAHE